MSQACIYWMGLQVDTKDILFICGGAFIDLDRQVAERTATSSIGFGNPVRCQPPRHLAWHQGWLMDILINESP